MPKIIGEYKTVKFGHKVKVESDVKPAFKGAKVAPWFFAVQVKNDKQEHACILLTEADFKGAEVVTGKLLPFGDEQLSLGVFKEGPKARTYIRLYNEEKGREDDYCFFKNTISRAFERASKYPHLCTSLGFFGKLFN